jgi:type IV pilus assembly protein PilC
LPKSKSALLRSHKIRNRIKSALFYPAAVIFMAVGILTALMAFVIPTFKDVLGELTGNRALPPFTEFVLDFSHVVKDHLLLVAVVVAGAVIVYKLVNNTGRGRAAIDRIKLRLPVVGRIIRKAAIARFSRTLGTMLDNGVPVLQALNISRETASNTVVTQAIQRTHERVKDGDTITAPLQNSGVFPSTVVSMIDVGEQTGALPTMLLKVADNYDDDVDNSISAALSLLEPALIIFLAVIVGSIVIALFLPIIGIINHGFTPSDADQGG